MPIQSFYKSFESTSLTQIETKTLFSNHGVDSQGLKEAHSMINDPNNAVLLPVYHTTKDNNIADTQMSITGSCKRGESFDSAAIREVKEEIGLTPQSLQLIGTESFGRKKNRYQLRTYITDANTCVLHSEQSSPTNLLGDDKKRKVQIIVYGRVDLLLRISEMINHRPPSLDNLINSNQRFYIGGIRIVSTESIHNRMIEIAFQRLRTSQGYARKKIFWAEQREFNKIEKLLLSCDDALNGQLDINQRIFRLGFGTKIIAFQFVSTPIFDIFLSRVKNEELYDYVKLIKEEAREFRKLFMEFDASIRKIIL